jgi:hypothetical protein
MHGGLRGVMAQAACRCGTLVVLDDAIGLILSFELVGFLFVFVLQLCCHDIPCEFFGKMTFPFIS